MLCYVGSRPRLSYPTRITGRMRQLFCKKLTLLFLFSNVFYAETGTVDRIYIHDNKPSLKGSDIQLVCAISDFPAEGIFLYKSDSKLPSSISDIKSLVQCFPSFCLTTTIDRYTFSADNSNVFINISSVNRSEDQKWWTCAIENQRKDMFLAVISVPTSLKYENPPTQDQDLAHNAVQLKCSTGCSFPQPTFTWYYSESGKDSLQTWSSSGSASDTTTGCSDSDRKYSSTLSLPIYTTFPGNMQKTVKFKCSIQSFTAMSQPLYTSYSTGIQFAVQVSSATLRDGSSTVSGQLQVVSGVSKTLKCDTSVSRPAATIVWFIGTREKQRSKSNTFTFNPQNSDHGEEVYCKAFNTQPESQAVISFKSRLNVQVQVSSATLKDGSSTISGQLQVVSGVSKTLTCDTSVSRPAATIVWYIGTQDKQRSTSKTFTFNPQNSDHTKQVYCKAFNTQHESQAVISNKSTLYVTVYAATPTLTNKTTGSMILLENDPITMECITSATRPAATVTWWKGSISLTNIQNTNMSQGNLISVKSVVSFTPSKADDKKVIYCQSFVSGQSNTPSAQQTIKVYWPPSTPSIPRLEFPFLENQTGKSIYCSSQDYGNPASIVRWNKQYGLPDNSDSRRLNLPTMKSQMDGSSVSCQLENYFTQVKGSTIKSISVALEVEYNPIVHIMVDGIITKSETRNEGQTLSVLCNATGNPIPTAKWIGQSPSSSNLTLHDIDRTNHGRYTCRAEATSEKYRNHDFVTETIIDVNVNHAPTVAVSVSETDPVENISLQIICHASGRPAIYSFTSIVQTWRGIKISNTHLPGDRNFNGVINIQKLQLEDSGTYTCHVNNGISDRNQQLDQIGKTDVAVKVSPKVLLEDGHKFAGAPGKAVNITIPFFSYPVIKEVNFQFQNGTVIGNSNKYTISFTRKNVTTKFYDKTVELEGYVAILRIEKEEQQDFVNYTLVLKNAIGQPMKWNIHHISESLPLSPKYINYTGLVNGVPTFVLVGNFNGGRPQTFVIETSIPPSTNWEEVLRFNETDEAFRADGDNLFKFNITGLSPNTYILRVLSENTLGRINETHASTIEFTISPSDEPSPEPPVGAIVGVLAGAAAAGLIVFGVIFFMRRTKKKGENTTALHGRGHESDDSEDEVMTENQAYVSADEVGIAKQKSIPDAVYSQPKKRDKKALGASADKTFSYEDPSSLYSMPDKKENKNQKKQKKGKEAKNVKPKKNKEEEQYANASEMKTVKKGKEGKLAYEENPYENPEEMQPKVNRNKDGLIYADLTFNDQPKGQKKLVIHGLDDMTEYVQVDFTKKAEPLPDSDDEKK